MVAFVLDVWVPLMVTAACAGAALLMPRSWERARGAALGIAAALASLALYAWALGAPHWPPAGAEQRFALAIAAAGVCGGLAGAWPSFRWGAAVLGAAATVATVAWPGLRLDAGLVPLLVGSMLICAGAGSLAELSRRGRGVAAMVVLTGLSLAAAAALLGSGNMKLAHLAMGPLGASLALTLLAAAGRAGPVGPGVAVAGMSLLGGLLVWGTTYGELWAPAGAILVLAPIGGLAADLALGERLSAAKRGAVAVLVAAVLAGVGVGLAVDISGEQDAADDTGYEGYGY